MNVSMAGKAGAYADKLRAVEPAEKAGEGLRTHRAETRSRF